MKSDAIKDSDLLGGITIGTIGLLKRTPDTGLLVLPNGPGDGGLWQALLVTTEDTFHPIVRTRCVFDTAKDAEEFMWRVVRAARAVDLLGDITEGQI